MPRSRRSGLAPCDRTPGTRVNSRHASSKPPVLRASARRRRWSPRPSMGARKSGGQPPGARPRAKSARSRAGEGSRRRTTSTPRTRTRRARTRSTPWTPSRATGCAKRRPNRKPETPLVRTRARRHVRRRGRLTWMSRGATPITGRSWTTARDARFRDVARRVGVARGADVHSERVASIATARPAVPGVGPGRRGAER